MNYEEKLNELEDISKKLENDLPIEKAVELYSKGTIIIKDCLENLEKNKGEVFKIKKELDKYIEEKMK